jgi:hypothetical protein
MMDPTPPFFCPYLQVNRVTVDYNESDPNATKLLKRLLEMEDAKPVNENKVPC